MGQPPQLVEESVQLCGLLPSAIRITALRLRSHRLWTLADLRDRLQDEDHGLTEPLAGEHGLAATFKLSPTWTWSSDDGA